MSLDPRCHDLLSKREGDRYMMLPTTKREEMLGAMERHDRGLGNAPEWRTWTSNGNYEYAIDFNNQLYPPKEIISFATGTSKGTFSGGPESNSYLESYGFSVVPLRDKSFSMQAVTSEGISTRQEVTAQ